jgi:hypothetical protein
MDDGAIVLGNVELTAKAVTLSVNSEARAARGRALLEPVLAGLVRAPLVERQTVEQMMALSRDRSSAEDALRPPPDEERRIIHQGLTDHYRRTLDEPIPSLGNQSPRKAAKTRKGREKVIGWLKMLENHSAQQGRNDPVGSYDFTWIWKELDRIERHGSTSQPRGHLSHESCLQLTADRESDSMRVFTSAFESVKIRSRRCRKPPIPKPALFGPNLLADRIGSGRQSQSTFSPLSHCIFGSLYQANLDDLPRWLRLEYCWLLCERIDALRALWRVFDHYNLIQAQ